MPTKRTSIKLFKCRARHEVGRYVHGQGFQTLSFAREQRHVARQWDERAGETAPDQQMVLSPAAIAVIKAREAAGDFRNREKELEPHSMPPSVVTRDYSKWCTFCGEFGRTLILCAGCRVGICSVSRDSPSGCFFWNQVIERDDFVFYCHYCSAERKEACLLELRQANLPHVHDIWHRYDPPVLVVAITWFQTTTKFGKLVYDLLSRSYAGNEGSLLWLDITLGGDAGGSVSYEGGDSMEEVPDPAKCARTFLAEHRSAKILVVVDAHCIENGFFVYAGNHPTLYEACSLGEILEDCIPKGVFKYLHDTNDSPNHNHKSMVINLACGPSITNDISRHSLTEGHSVHAIFSLGNNTTIVGAIATTVAAFAARWVQSPSGYDFLVASTIPASWALFHMPVISTEGQHFLYRKSVFAEPEGKYLVCHNLCRRGFKTNSRNTKWRILCNKCGSKCTIPKTVLETKEPLGRQKMLKVGFPQAQYTNVDWISQTSTSDGSTPPPLNQPSPDLASGVQPAPPTVEATSSTSRGVAPPRLKTPALPTRPLATDEVSCKKPLPALPKPGVGPSSSRSPSVTIRLPPLSSISRASSNSSLANDSASQRKVSDGQGSGGARKKQKRE